MPPQIQTGPMAWTRGELLGEGAYGRVYAGLNQKTGELMAVKVLDLMDRRGNHMHMHLAELQQVIRGLGVRVGNIGQALAEV